MSKDEKSTYYDIGGIEVLDIIQAKLTNEQFKGYLLGNSLKYLLRCNWKGNIQRDLEKSSNYTKWLNNIENSELKNIFTIEGNYDNITAEMEKLLNPGKEYKVTIEETKSKTRINDYIENFNEGG